MSALKAIAIKDLRLLGRDRANAFFTFVFPLLLAVFFGAVFAPRSSGPSRGMRVAVVNESGGEASKGFIADLKKAEGLAVSDATTRAEGEKLVRDRSVIACIVVPRGFDSAAENMFGGSVMRVEAVVDPTRNAEAGLLTGKLNEIAFGQMSKVWSDPSRMTKQLERSREEIAKATDLDPASRLVLTTFFAALDNLSKSNLMANSPAPAADGTSPDTPGRFNWKPVEVSVSTLKIESSGPPSSWAISFPQGVVWGLMGCVTAFGLSLAFERTHGTLMRLTTSPASRSTILLGKALACFISCVFVQIMLIAFAMIVFGLSISSPVAMVFAVVMSSFGFVGVMMLLAGMSRSEGAAAGFGRALVLILAMIGGGTIPVFMMPEWLDTASNISPFKWAIVAVEGALWRGLSVIDLAVPFLVLAVMGVVGYLVGAAAFKVSDSK